VSTVPLSFSLEQRPRRGGGATLAPVKGIVIELALAVIVMGLAVRELVVLRRERKTRDD